MKITLHCIVCGKPFETWPSRIKTGDPKYCSLGCRGNNRIKKTIATRFWEHVDKKSDIECWLWKGSFNEHGYGQLFVGTVQSQNGKVAQKHAPAHRISYQLFNGTIPRGLFVLHRCDTPSCVNPKHLFIGTQLDNMKDASNKGRMSCGDKHYAHTHPELLARGEKHGSSKLREQDIIKIRELAASGIKQSEIASLYSIGQYEVSRIVSRKRWCHVK